ncbi:asparagine synthase (glutamine-hydrolyzing) [Dyella sp. Tek66A03]|uniref:asparagine synthase (glutamine-hydrolyzing) n=1 Tax=Dyella sp. Tek66A03 TaxID=3458298 RepID=UPI00403E8127
MCGICGILDRNSGLTARVMEPKARVMLQAMAHRGPNGSAMYSRDEVVMAVNRLAIRGVDELQPPLIEYGDGIVVACNGEIDNHRELRLALAQSGYAIPQSTDVAVIAPLYLQKGLDFLLHLHGAFAIALWDARKQRLILARDRAGERHLYYSTRDRAVHFASELSALVAAQPSIARIDQVSLAHYLRSGYCPSPRSLLEGYHKVRPGEMIVIEPAGKRHVRYWSSPIGTAKKSVPSPDAFDPIFRNAVRRQSDIDVDYGVLLSGGIDSALITAVARSLRPEKRLPAYCIRFAEASFDEGRDAAQIAHHLGCDFVPVTIAPEDVPDGIRQLVSMTGEPLADPAWLPLSLVTKRASQEVRVLLGGEGADELFGGYPTYLGAHLASRYARLPTALRLGIRQLVDRLPVSDKKVSTSFLLKRFVSGQELDGMTRHMLWTAGISPDWLRRLGVAPPFDRTDHDPRALIDAIQNYDFGHSLPDALMAKADRGGMSHGVEIRAPFLDQTVIEFAATLPLNARIRGITTKVFLKDYARRYLPRSVITRRKRGLSVPLSQWLRGPLFDWASARLTSGALVDAGISIEAAQMLLAELRLRARDHSRAIWTLIVLSEWLEWLARSRNAYSYAADIQPMVHPIVAQA